ncbi:hypothetical protein FRC11_011861 [Ceratobasidium sp. 423]|nr:hypothetical protein FRC11_011861 [Ceratobasidium sp. 423]
MALNTATGATISLPSFASSFEARSTHSSRSNSPGFRLHHYCLYSESNTRGAPPDDRSRKRPAPIDEEPELDVGTQNNPEQDVVNESGELSTVPVKEEQVSELEQSPSPSPSAGESRRYAHALPRPTAQTQLAPTPPTSAHHVSPPHVALPTLPQRHRDADLTLVLHAPPEPQPQPQQADHHYDEPTPARKRRRVTVSGVAAGSEAAPLPLHRTILERANNGYQSHDPLPQSLPAGQTATLASPTIPLPVQNTITPLTLPTTTPTAPTDPLAQTQALAHRRGKGLSKLIIPLNSSISSVQDANGRLGIPDIRAAIRSAPPDITRFNLPYTQRPQPAQVRDVRPLKERSVSIQRIHADSTASTTAAPAPLGIVAPGQPPVLNAPTPSSSHIVTPTQFPLHTSHPQSPRTPTKSESILSKREQSSNSTPRTSEMVIHSAMVPTPQFKPTIRLMFILDAL